MDNIYYIYNVGPHRNVDCVIGLDTCAILYVCVYIVSSTGKPYCGMHILPKLQFTMDSFSLVRNKAPVNSMA